MKWICLNYLSGIAPRGFNQHIHLFQRKVKNVHSQTGRRSLGFCFECHLNHWLLQQRSPLSVFPDNKWTCFLFRFLVQSRSIGNHLLFFFCPAGQCWIITAESAHPQRSCCSGLCPIPFPVPHLSLYFYKHKKLKGYCWEDYPAPGKILS